MAEFKLSHLAEYCSLKHFLTPNRRASDISEVTRNLIGLHSARLLTPFISLYVRLPGFRPHHLQEQMWVEKELIKLRCMRRTLHTVTLELAPIVHAATRKLRTADCASFYRKNHVSSEDVSCLKSQFIEVAEHEPREASHFFACIKPYLQNRPWLVEANRRDELLRIVLKHMWEEGTLCYVNKAPKWSSEKRYYGVTSTVYPELLLDKYSEFEAQVELVKLHIEKFGPVAVEDITWWSGLSRRIVRSSIERLKDSLVVVAIEDYPDELYMEASDFESLRRHCFDHEPWITLLAYEDPTLKGYHATRRRYVSDEAYKHLFNAIGEARASIAVNGRVIGTWRWSDDSSLVNYELFESIPNSTRSSLLTRISELESWFRAQSSNQQMTLF